MQGEMSKTTLGFDNDEGQIGWEEVEFMDLLNYRHLIRIYSSVIS
jgi:hypothetical protein